jgi:hypothetical protein
MKRLLALTAMGLWGTACTTAMYSGSRRSSDEVAVLITTNGQVMMDGKSQSGVSTRVAKIDGKEINGSSFELLPGRHSVEVTGTKKDNPGGGAGVIAAGALGGPAAALGFAAAGSLAARTEKSRPLVACFIARPRHTYEVRTFGNSDNAGSWEIEIVDQNTTYVVTSACNPAPGPASKPSMNQPPPATSSPAPSSASPSP